MDDTLVLTSIPVLDGISVFVTSGLYDNNMCVNDNNPTCVNVSGQTVSSSTVAEAASMHDNKMEGDGDALNDGDTERWIAANVVAKERTETSLLS